MVAEALVEAVALEAVLVEVALEVAALLEAGDLEVKNPAHIIHLFERRF